MDAAKLQEELKKWQARAEKLAATNEALRAGVMRIQERADDLPHVIMRDGSSLKDFCRALLVGG